MFVPWRAPRRVPYRLYCVVCVRGPMAVCSAPVARPCAAVGDRPCARKVVRGRCARPARPVRVCAPSTLQSGQQANRRGNSKRHDVCTYLYVSVDCKRRKPRSVKRSKLSRSRVSRRPARPVRGRSGDRCDLCVGVCVYNCKPVFWGMRATVVSHTSHRLGGHATGRPPDWGTAY